MGTVDWRREIEGFTDHGWEVITVSIDESERGELEHTVRRCPKCREWVYMEWVLGEMEETEFHCKMCGHRFKLDELGRVRPWKEEGEGCGVRTDEERKRYRTPATWPSKSGDGEEEKK